MKCLLILVTLSLLLNACATFTTTAYRPSVKGIEALKTMRAEGKEFNLLTTTSSLPDAVRIGCRDGSIKTNTGAPFAIYLDKAIREEMQIAKVLSPSGKTVQIELRALELDSIGGLWTLHTQVKSGVRSFQLDWAQKFNASYFSGVEACTNSANMFTDVVAEYLSALYYKL